MAISENEEQARIYDENAKACEEKARGATDEDMRASWLRQAEEERRRAAAWRALEE